MDDMKRVERIEILPNGQVETHDYGFYSAEDIKLITKGYKFNGMFYERKNGKFIFIVE